MTFTSRQKLTAAALNAAFANHYTKAEVDELLSSTLPDTTPSTFSFTDVSDVALSTLTESNTITVVGIYTATAISVTGGQYSKNGGSYTSSAGTVVNGDTVKVRATSSGDYATAVNVALTIGGVSDTFTVTTTVGVHLPLSSYTSGADLTAAGLTFTRASSGTRLNSSGVFVTETTNTPRFDHNAAGFAKGLLIEEARTNYMLASSDLSDGAWGNGGVTITVNAANAPDGTTTADKIDFTSVSGTSSTTIVQNITLPAGDAAQSLFLKGVSGGEQLWLMWTPNGTDYVSEPLALTTSWQEFTNVGAVGASAYFGVGVDLRDSTQTAQGAQSAYVWGGGVQKGAAATSLIPTTSSTSTRAADTLTIPIPADVSKLRFTFDDDSTQLVAVANSSNYVVPTNLNRRHIKSVVSVPNVRVDNNIVVQGDSLSVGATATLPWPDVAFASPLETLTNCNNTAVSGREASYNAANISMFSSLYDASKRNVSIVFLGTNDFGLDDATAAQALTSIDTICSGMKTAGFEVIVFTLPPALGTANAPYADTYNAQVAAFNSALVGTAKYSNGTVADHVFRLDNKAEFSDPTNLTYYNADQIHYTDLGYTRIGQYVRTFMQGLGYF